MIPVQNRSFRTDDDFAQPPHASDRSNNLVTRPGGGLSTPVLLMLHKREHTTRKVLEKVREARPPRLYVSIDGPRPDREGEAEAVRGVRDLFYGPLGWECELHVRASERNLGCRRHNSEALDWFFGCEDRGIILEDDCLASDDFFPFCEELLEKYEDDPRIFSISGDNFQRGRIRGDGSYYFSQIQHCWGWASWRRAWSEYRSVEASLGDALDRYRAGLLPQLTHDPAIDRMWMARIREVVEGSVDSWAYIWSFCCLLHRGLTVLPNRNLVQNIGFGPGATHTNTIVPHFIVAAENLDWPLRHPTRVEYDRDADDTTYHWNYGVDIPAQRQAGHIPGRPNLFSSPDGVLKVLSLGSIDSPGAGGATLRLQDALCANGVDAVFVTLQKTSSSPRVFELTSPGVGSLFSHAMNHAQEPLRKAPGFAPPTLFSTSRSPLSFQQMRPLVEQADVVHIHWSDGFLNYPEAAEVLSGKAVFVTLHDTWAFTGGCHCSYDCRGFESRCENCPQLPNDARNWPVDSLREKLSFYEKVRPQFIASSEDSLRLAKGSAAGRGREISRIPLPVDLETYRPRDNAGSRRRLGLPEVGQIVAFGATEIHRTEKGFSYLLDALRNLAGTNRGSITLCVFGNLKHFDPSGLPFPVKALGFIADEATMRDVYSCADLYVFPSMQESFGLTVVESLACGTPVVGFPAGCVPDFIRDGVNGFIAKKGDALDLALKIESMLALMERDGNEIRQNCRKIAEKEFDRDMVAQRHIRLYRSALDAVAGEATILHKSTGTPAGPVDAALGKADALFQSGDREAALSTLRACDADTADLRVVNASAWILLQMGKYSEAQLEYVKATQLWPRNPSVHANLAGLFIQRGADDRAEGPLRRVLELNPNDPDALIALARLLRRIGRSPEANELARRFLATHAARPEAAELRSLAAESTQAADKSRQARENLAPADFDRCPVSPTTHSPDFVRFSRQRIPESHSEKTPAKPTRSTGTPLVSAVVSTYKSERFLRACLEDLVGQTLFKNGELEIVVVDAASPESEGTIVEEFRTRHPSIVYLRVPERESLYASWNRGFRASRGRFVTNANTDDSHRTDALELLARALEETPEADVAFADCFWTDTPNDKWESTGTGRKRINYPEYHPASVLHWCTLGPHPMWRRELFDQIGWFDPEWKSAGDLEFMIRFAAAGRKALHVPDALSLFYQNQSGLSQSGSEGSREEQEVLRRWWSRFPIERAYKVDESDPKAMADAWTALGARALRCGAPWAPEHAFPEHSLVCFLKALELDPASAHAAHFASELAKAFDRQDLLPRSLRESVHSGPFPPNPAVPLPEPPPAVPGLSWFPSRSDLVAPGPLETRTVLEQESTPSLHAFAPALNFTGYARLNREAFLALEEAGTLRLSLDPSVNNAEFIKGLEAQGEAATAPWNRIVSREPDHSGFCLISDLPCNFAKLRASRSAFAKYAGLTMFETDRLPAGWKDDCLGVDEIWVPSSFNLRSFAAAGVPERMLKRIPCGIDMDRFRPGAAAPLRVEGRRRTNFLSVFEWTPRKGWDVLLLGWANAFSRDDDASLTLKAYIADSRPGELAAKIESFYRSRGIDPASLAPIIVVDGFLPEAAMPGLYASADVFALPSRGEGWGLPYLESMASGVPVIATEWSAHLDFVTSENGYLVDHELVSVSKEQTNLSSYYGADHRWADPSVDHFADLLRRCHRDRDEVRAKGARARIEVQEAYSARRTAEWISEQARGNGAKRPTATVSESVTPPVAPSLPRLGFDARTLSVPDSIVRGIGNYAWHHLLAILETRPGCDITILHDDAIQPPMEIVERTKALGAKWAPWSSRTASDFDIFHTPDPMHVYPGYPSPFQRYGSTRVTATFYDIIPIRMYEGRISNWPGYLARLDEIGACGATLLCISEFTRKDLLSATSIAPDKAITVMAGFNASSSGRTWTRQEGDALLRRLGIDKPFFLHVGAADPHKNFESALAACQALGKSRPVQFVVAGKLANALGAMRDQIVQAGLKDVVFTDYLTREELELLYSRAVATLFLSRYEGFGFPALEAMACGCPVIASNAASIPEVVGDAALVHGPDDLPGIASSMVRLLDTPALRDDLVRRGRERASRFDWKDVARRTWDAWDRIMSGPSPIPAPPPAPARVRWLSPVWDPSGYGDESRAFVRHLAATDLGANLLAWGRHSESFRQEATPEDRRLLDGLMGREFEPGSPVVLDIPAHAMGRLPGAGHHVGRTTFETDGLPSEWVARCNAMDEIWVPCAFNRETFAKAGVTKPILVVPEGVDTSKFRPGLAPLDLPGPRKAVTYLAVFEWTHRKAPDLLIQAWATAFTSADDVRLVLRTYPPNQIEGDPIAWVESRIDEELARVGKRRADCAPISAIARQVPDADMPGLYAAADVYLAPSRGEGWGRPHMEAMSCGLPVVATRWSGNLDFQTDDNSWLIEIDGLEEIDAREEFPFYRGQKWAKPSLADFVRILRISRDDRDLRRAKGERARRDMMQKWDWSKIAPLAETRIREILEGVPAERSSLLARSAIRQDVSPRNPSPSSRSIPGSSAPIRWAGPVFNYSGYARLARETLKGLMDAGVPVSCDPQLSDNAFFASLSGKNAEISRWKSLLATEPVPGPLVICDLPRDANGGDILGALQRDNPGCGKRIAWTMFETDRLPEGWASALNTLDEVWVPSRFNRETFAAAGVMGSKLHVVPGCIDATPYAQAHPMTLPGSGYAFLSVFQWIERKGYDVLLDAWAKAFKPTDPVRLVLRCHPFGDAPPVEEQLEAFLSLRGLRRRDLAPIHVLDSFLPDAEMPSLFAACDCFVLPSRGEGWGLPYLEAMASAKPVIGTAWSAQTEFLTTDNSWLLSPRAPVPVTMTENGKATFLDPSHRWADPDPTELARLLRHAFDHQEEGRAKGLRGSEDARSLWTPARTAAAIAARLSAGSAAPGKDIHRPAPPSPPADASISTKVSSALAKVAEGIRTTSHPATSARKVESIDPTTPSAKLSIRWEGSQFVHHSLAHVNRELCLRLARNGHALSLIPFEPDQFAPGDDPDLSLLARLHNAPLDKACQIHVRHQWPPNLEAPAHGNWVVIQPWEFGSPPKQWISAFADRLDDLWVPSSYCRDLYVDGGMPADRVHVVPNGVDCNRFRPGLAPYALATKKTFKFLYVGGTIARKGFDTLLNAWKEAFGPDDDVCLVVKDMGGGTFYKGQTAKAWIQEMQESRKCAEIEYLDGDMEPNQIPSLYAACDVLVHPYRGEGFGLPIAEAMACGLPCVVTRGGAADDFCGETESWGVQAKRVPVPGGKVGPFETVSPPWWLEPSVPDLVEKLRIAKSDHEARRSKGDAARRRIVEGFTWDKAAAIAEERLLEIASRPPRRSASGPRFVSALDKLSLRITNPGGKLAPAASPALPGTGVADGEVDLAELNRLLVRAEAAAARGELGEAEHLTEDAVARFPHQNLAWLARAMVLRGLGKFRKASEAIDRAIKERETPEALLESLQIHLLAGDAAPARKIEKALKERHAAWFKETRELFRTRGQTWPPDLLKPARAANKPAPPTRKGKR